MTKGIFYGIGVGPGDPELITVKGLRILEQTQVVCVPKSRAEGDSLAWRIASQYLPDSVEVLELTFPMVKETAVLARYWGTAARNILERIEQGLNVVFLTLGDPSLYSTYAYVVQALRQLDEEVTVQTIPGITSLTAGAARINYPLALGDEPLVVLPNWRERSELVNYLKTYSNVVVLKASQQFDELLDALNETGRTGFLVSKCGLDDEKVVTDLEQFRPDKVDYLSMVIVQRNPKTGPQGQ